MGRAGCLNLMMWNCPPPLVFATMLIVVIICMLTPYSEVGFYLEYHLHDLHQGTYYQPQTYCTYQGKICMTLVKVNKKAMYNQNISVRRQKLTESKFVYCWFRYNILWQCIFWQCRFWYNVIRWIDLWKYDSFTKPIMGIMFLTICSSMEFCNGM